MNWLSWSFAYPALAWFAVRAWASWRIYHLPSTAKITRGYDKRPAPFAGGVLLIGLAVIALPFGILEGEWLGFRTSFSPLQWKTMTTPSHPGHHPDVAAALLFEVAFQIAAFTYSLVVAASFRKKAFVPLALHRTRAVPRRLHTF